MSPTLDSPMGLGGIAGFRSMGIHAGIKKHRLDLAVLVSDTDTTTAAAVFTQNAFAAAPVHISRQHVANGNIRAVVVNSGCANACTGRQGMRDALDMARETADGLGLTPEQVLVCSTGKIGVNLPMDLILPGIQSCVARLDEGTGSEISQAILTTDTGPKEERRDFAADNTEHQVIGIAKGAGMIYPNMATMLGFLLTDANVPAPALRRALRYAVDRSFNQITVDGDESTNDTVVLLANGAAGGPVLTPDSPHWPAFQDALLEVCQGLAMRIAADGEGATKLMHVHVEGAASGTDARKAARAIARSNLVKSAIHGEDPNWGRIVSAAGSTGIRIDPTNVILELGDLNKTIQVVVGGEPQPGVDKQARQLLSAAEIVVRLHLNQGDGSGTAWGCDLTQEYVTFNSAYTT